MVGKKKRNHPDIEELLARPWCYYCERDFDDLKILISHQKAKHFKCERCGRRLNTAGGLSVHMNQVHKENLTSVDNSLPNRQGLEVEIFGMEGIPEDVAQAHNQRIIAGFYEAEAQRRAATGNPGPGASGTGGQAKKPKFESPADLKKRLAEHKARKAEQAAAGESSGGNTPMDNSHNSPIGQSPGAYNGSPFPPPQASYSGAPGAGYGSFPEASPAAYQPYAQTASFSGPPGAQFLPQQSPPQPYQASQSFPPSGYPATQAPTTPYNPYPSHAPPSYSALPNRPPSLPPAPGLPQRPSFGAPQVAPYQMQQMHQAPPQGGWASNGNGWKGHDQNSAMSPAYPHPPGFNGDYPTNASSVDDLVAGAAREADDIDEIIRMAEAGIKPPKKGEKLSAPPEIVATQTPLPETNDKIEKAEPSEKKSKKEKPIKMIYSDSNLSPEEKMMEMPRYAFNPEAKTESELVDAVTVPGVVGTVGA